MPGTALKIGPWVGGLNLRDDPRLIADNELSDCINFDILDDGTLVPRRALRNSSLLAEGQKRLLGSINSGGDLFALFTSHNDGVSQNYFYKTNDGQTVTSAFNSMGVQAYYSSALEYGSKIWVVAATAATESFSAPNLVADGLNDIQYVAELPPGDQAFMLKDRMFVVRYSNSTIYYSKVTDPTDWTSTVQDPYGGGGFFGVNAGDGLPITSVVVINNQMYIFKKSKTYSFTFSENPLKDGNLVLITPDQGAFASVVHNNEVYAINNNSIFKFINGYFVDIAEKLNIYQTVKLDNDKTGSGVLCVIEDTLFVAITFTTASKNKYFAMNLNNGAWSEYKFPTPDTNYGGELVTPASKSINARSDAGSFVIFGDKATKRYVPYFGVLRTTGTNDTDQNAAIRYPGYGFATKLFTFDNENMWKRLYSWAADLRQPIFNPTLTPAAYSEVAVNDGENTYQSTDFIGKITVKSARFKAIMFKWIAYTKVGNPTNMAASGSLNSSSTTAPSIRSLVAWINMKAPVVK